MAVDYKTLKKGGFMRQIQKDCFSMRLRTFGGQLTSLQMKKIYEIAEVYGEGYVHLTSRQGVEIPFIKLGDVEIVKEKLAEAGLEPGACGPRVRTITACQGSTICPSGLIDTTSLAQEFDQKYFGRELPHKFKIGITGCRNNCLKAEENDLGIKGGIKPRWKKDTCSFCGLCEAVCAGEAIKLDKSNETLSFDQGSCTYCGKCVKSCPVSAWEGETGYVISLGGTFGNQISVGQVLPIVQSKEDLEQIVESSINFFERYGKPGERFRSTVNRVGWNKLRQNLLGDEVIRDGER